MQDLASVWVRAVGAAVGKVSPADLYQGRAFSEIRTAARISNADLQIVSAGLGLVPATEEVPSYSLTVSDGSGSIRNWLEARGAIPSDWWTVLTTEMGAPNPLSDLINSTSLDGVVLLALPASYLGMVYQDLSQIAHACEGRLRIFTSEAGVRLLPDHLKKTAMPYDGRLEGLPDHAGTRTEFPHRALRHFVEKLGGHLLTLPQANAAVTSALHGLQCRSIPKRLRATDSKICDLIRANWVVSRGSSNKLLRVLRDDALVACEQARFVALVQLVRGEMQQAGVS